MELTIIILGCLVMGVYLMLDKRIKIKEEVFNNRIRRGF